MFDEEVIKLAKPCIEAIKKISGGKWEWEPEVGEWFAYGHTGLGLIIGVRDKQWLLVHNHEYELHKDNGIPLLHWERIREIMLSLGFKLYFRNPLEGATIAFAKLKELECDKDIIEEMYRDEHIPSNRWYHAPSCQSAVMRAVIELAKGG